MKLVFLGPPGAGKGTVAALLTKRLGIPHISTGDLFRAAVKDATPLGLKVKDVLASGGLVSDELTIALVRERLAGPDVGGGWILDGFPRTVAQAEALQAMAPVECAVNLEVPDELVIRRLSTRRVCRFCGAIYNAETKPPKIQGRCDACGGEVYTRDDDQAFAIRTRLEKYREQTAPLVEWYERKALLLGFSGDGSAEAVFERVIKALANGR